MSYWQISFRAPLTSAAGNGQDLRVCRSIETRRR